MLMILTLCVVCGVLIARPIIRAMRRDWAELGLIEHGAYLRTPRRVSRLARVTSNSFAVRL